MYNVSLAQLVEQLTLNQWVESSSLSGDTKVQESSMQVSLSDSMWMTCESRKMSYLCTAFPLCGLLVGLMFRFAQIEVLRVEKQTASIAQLVEH